MKNRSVVYGSLIFALVFSIGCGSPNSDQASRDAISAVNAAADFYWEWYHVEYPETALYTSYPDDHQSRFADNSLEGVEKRAAVEDSLLSVINRIEADLLNGTQESAAYAILRHKLESDLATRVCRKELWNVRHMQGWQLAMSDVAKWQPVGTDEARRQSLTRWSSFPDFVDQEIANLRVGLELGYSSPKSVVRRVITQIDKLIAFPLEDSPFYSPALRDGDLEFSQSTAAIVKDRVVPALKRYRDFLESSYLEAARSERSIVFNPDGEECYHASIKSYTGSEKTTEEIFSLGQETVEANRKVVMEKGEPIYGVSEMQEIVDAANSDPENQFSSKEELLEFARNAVERAGREMPNWVVVMPNIPVVVNPLPPEMEGTVTSASYQESDGDRPASYRQPLAGYAELTKGGVERTAFHEAWPGHHLQRATRLSLAGVHPIAELIYIAGYNEGWGRYAEALAEEMGLYRTTSGPILRRAWPGRGMVVDPGIHLYGWTDQQAIDFIVEGGRNTLSSARDVLDRIAILPGQLTSYDTGGLEIMALRTEAENRLGDDFDIREFHHVVLSGGEVPLNQLRLNVENWISH